MSGMRHDWWSPAVPLVITPLPLEMKLPASVHAPAEVKPFR